MSIHGCYLGVCIPNNQKIVWPSGALTKSSSFIATRCFPLFCFSSNVDVVNIPIIQFRVLKSLIYVHISIAAVTVAVVRGLHLFFLAKEMSVACWRYGPRVGQNLSFFCNSAMNCSPHPLRMQDGDNKTEIPKTAS